MENNWGYYLNNILLFISGLIFLGVLLSKDALMVVDLLTLLPLFLVTVMLLPIFIAKMKHSRIVNLNLNSRPKIILLLLSFVLSVLLILRTRLLTTILTSNSFISAASQYLSKIGININLDLFSFIILIGLLFTVPFSTYFIYAVMKYLYSIFVLSSSIGNKHATESNPQSNNKSFFIGVIAISAVTFLLYLPRVFYGGCTWGITTWAFNYSYGFINRGFLGTLLNLISYITGISPSPEMWRIIALIGEIIFTVCILSFIYYIIKNLSKSLDTNIHKSIKLLIILFVAGSGLSTIYNLYGPQEMYMIILTLFACYLIVSKSQYLWSYIGVIIMSILCMLIHNGYVFMYFNIVLVLLFYKTFLSSNKRINGFPLFTLIISFVLCSTLFIYFQFIAQVNPDITLNSVIEHASLLVGYENALIQKGYISEYLFGVEGLLNPFMGIKAYSLNFIIGLFLYSPFIYLIIHFWKNVVKSEPLLWRKLIYVAIPLGILTTIPLFVMHLDYGRWCYSIYFYEFIVIFLLLVLNDNAVSSSLHHIMHYLKERPIYLAFILVYSVILGAFTQNYINYIIENIIEISTQLLSILI